MRRPGVLALAVACAAAVPAAAQTTRAVVAQVSPAVHHDTSPPLRELVREAAPPTGLRVEIPLRVVPGQRRPQGTPSADPVLQRQDRPFPEAAPTPDPNFHFEGLSDQQNGELTGFVVVPPDTEGDVGKDHYVQWVNVILAVYAKDDPSGTPILGPVVGNSLWTGFPGVCGVTNDGDPIALYDHLADRWLLSQFSIFAGTQCIAISTTGDPTGSYHRYEFLVTPGGLNDYPKLSVWEDAYYLSLRDFDATQSFVGSSAVALERSRMLNGEAAQMVKFTLPCVEGDCVDGIQPGHLEGPPPPTGTPNTFSVVWDDDFDGPLTGADGYRLYSFVVDWTSPGSSSFTELPLAASAGFDRDVCGFFVRSCVPQPAPGEGLDPIDELTMYRAQFRHHDTHDSLLLNHTVDAGGDRSGVRWAELRDTGSGWSVFQEGTFAPEDGLHRWMGSLAMDAAGNIAVGYSASGPSTFPSIRYTSRAPGDPAGTLPGGEVEMIAGTGAQIDSSNRWGDYSTMSVDPVDGCTFWYTQEYYATTNSFDFKTRIGNFTFPSCLSGGGIPCADIQNLQARCRVIGGTNTIQARVILTDSSHSGETLTLSVDGEPMVLTITNRRAQTALPGASSGPHTVSLTDPAGCFPDRVVTCP